MKKGAKYLLVSVLAMCSTLFLITAAFLQIEAKALGKQIIKEYKWRYDKIDFCLKISLDPFAINRKASVRPPHANPDYYYSALSAPDESINDLAKALVAMASQNNFSREKTAELIAAFWQQLPYNRAEVDGLAVADYPAVSLLRSSGTCTDKAIGMKATLRAARFAACLLHFAEIKLSNGRLDEHMAVGLKGSGELAIFDGYAYCETYSQNGIGQVPAVNSNGGFLTIPGDKSVQGNYQRALRLGRCEWLAK